MDPPRFIEHYRVVILVLRRCGIPIPWLSTPPGLARIFYQTVHNFVISIIMYNLISFVYTIATMSLPFQDFCSTGIAGGCNTCALLVNLYHDKYSERLIRLTEKMDAISKAIMESDLDKKEEFLKEYQRNSKIMNILAKYSYLSGLTTSFFYFLSTPIIELFTGHYRENFPMLLAGYFNDRHPGVYEVIVLTTAASISISTATKYAYDCLFISILKLQTTFFKYLYKTQDIVQKELRDNAQSQKRFLTWIRLHQEIIKCNEELMLTFSPIILIYYVIVIEIVVCGMFVESKKENDNPMQSIGVGSYVMTNIVYYFLLSYTADELVNEAQKLVFKVYNVPWYQIDKSKANSTLLVMTMCSKPISVTAYKASIFIVNKETFVGFAFAVISSYLTLCKMGSGPNDMKEDSLINEDSQLDNLLQ